MNIPKLNQSKFLTIFITGIIATFVMSLTAFWQSGIGLVAMDPAVSILKSMNPAHPDIPYSLNVAVIYHYANGVMLALLYYLFIDGKLPGSWILKGLIYSVISTLLVAVIVAQIGFGAGFFFANTPAPALVSLSAFVSHGAYSMVLTLGLYVGDLIQ